MEILNADRIDAYTAKQYLNPISSSSAMFGKGRWPLTIKWQNRKVAELVDARDNSHG